MDRILPSEPHLRVQYSTRNFLAGLPTVNSLRNTPNRRATSFASFRYESSLDLLLYMSGF